MYFNIFDVIFMICLTSTNRCLSRRLPDTFSLQGSVAAPASFSLFSLSRSFFPHSLFASLSSLSFLLSYFLRTGCCHNNKGKSTRTENRTEKIIDNPGSGGQR